MAKLTRKDKKRIRSEVRKWAAHAIERQELPVETLWSKESSEGLAYLVQFKAELIQSMKDQAEDPKDS